MTPGHQLTADEDFWVERGTSYLDTVHRAMGIPRDVLDPGVYHQLYEEFSKEWLAENPSFPRSQGRDKQEEYYKRIDEACASLETVQQDDWRGICCAAQAGSQAIAGGDFQFPEDSPFRVAVWKRVTSNCKVITRKHIQARRQAAGRKVDMASSLVATRCVPKALGLGVDDTVTFFHPETNEVTEFTILGFGTRKGNGMWFTVAYTDNPVVEVELSEQAMEEILMARI